MSCLASSMQRLLGIGIPFTIKSQGDKAVSCRTALRQVNQVMGHGESCMFGDIMDLLPPTVKDWTQSMTTELAAALYGVARVTTHT